VPLPFRFLKTCKFTVELLSCRLDSNAAFENSAGAWYIYNEGLFFAAFPRQLLDLSLPPLHEPRPLLQMIRAIFTNPTFSHPINHGRV
jgi:hypothetical protein